MARRLLSAAYKTNVNCHHLFSADGITDQFVSDICASFQWAVAVHLAMRLERALVYCRERFPYITHLVRDALEN